MGIGDSQDWGFSQGCLEPVESCGTGVVPVEQLTLVGQTLWAGDGGNVPDETAVVGSQTQRAPQLADVDRSWPVLYSSH